MLLTSLDCHCRVLHILFTSVLHAISSTSYGLFYALCCNMLVNYTPCGSNTRASETSKTETKGAGWLQINQRLRRIFIETHTYRVKCIFCRTSNRTVCVLEHSWSVVNIGRNK